MPAINVRFPPKGNAIVAVAVPVGLKQLYLNTITLGGREGGYTASGTSFGYIGVRMPNGTITPKLDLNKPGLYYVATLDTNAPGQFQVSPIDAQLQAFRAGFKSAVGNLEPVNFQWPR